MPDLKAQRKSEIDAAQRIVQGAEAAGRDLSAKETTAVEAHFKEVEDIDVKLAAAAKGLELLRLVNPGGGSFTGNFGDDFDGTQPGYLQLGGKSARVQVGKAMLAAREEADFGTKALMTSGQLELAVDILPNPIPMGQPAQTLLDLLPWSSSAVNFSYLRQTTRTNLASPVASGGLKPTSVYSLTRLDDRLRVIAHISEGLDRFWLEDSSLLSQFIASEMIYGLRVALEGEILNGDGTGEHLRGLNATSGILVQAFVTSMVATARQALTKLFTGSGTDTGAFVFNPADWEAIELTVGGDGHYVLDTAQLPVDSAARRLWGMPVALSSAVPAGVGWLFGTNAVSIVSDKPGVRVDWSDSVASDFAQNMLRARCEGRFGLIVTQPAAVVKMDLTA